MAIELTYRKLRDQLNGLTEEQLDMNVKLGTDLFTEPMFIVNGVWIIDEDQVNPTGDSWEPVSSYRYDPELLAGVKPVAKKGDVYLFGESKKASN